METVQARPVREFCPISVFDAVFADWEIRLNILEAQAAKGQPNSGY
ncbi:hypothetical protein HC931_16680 [Candidatus Gracilibacteria bacterium]|nr:hypothetical protein [Candidatus Gracilibacteria bacterium]NJM87283.1 hypothetical protein [Hydrococcus sp. RU_2_2]NJP21570.1 hypothetical protein [Hydrococcus sp. CRU_1_1]NJQ98682.1 hypothetical protein [Hydrococcus sp. CSU_1_8]